MERIAFLLSPHLSHDILHLGVAAATLPTPESLYSQMLRGPPLRVVEGWIELGVNPRILLDYSILLNRPDIIPILLPLLGDVRRYVASMVLTVVEKGFLQVLRLYLTDHRLGFSLMHLPHVLKRAREDCAALIMRMASDVRVLAMAVVETGSRKMIEIYRKERTEHNILYRFAWTQDSRYFIAQKRKRS